MNVEDVATSIVDAAIKVHRVLGPGLLESAYQKCLDYELRKRNLRVECETVLPIVYDGQQIDAGYRIDMDDLSAKAKHQCTMTYERDLQVASRRLDDVRLKLFFSAGRESKGHDQNDHEGE